MKIGFCAKMDRAAEAAAAGFDYLEMPVTSVAEWTEEEMAENRKLLSEMKLETPSFNVLFPGTLKLLEKETREEDIRGYLQMALPRVRQLGGRVVVFGSGKSRMRPEGMSHDAAFRRLTEVTRLIGEEAEKCGLTIVIEPLNRGETNMICSVAEGACLAAAVNHPAVSLLGDYYHIAKENQPPEDIARVGGIRHAHIATLEGRRIPLAEEPGFRAMFSAMKQTGYDELISVEGKAENLAKEGPVAIRLIRRLWEEA